MRFDGQLMIGRGKSVKKHIFWRYKINFFEKSFVDSKISINFRSLGVMVYNNRTLNGLQVSDCANKNVLL